MRNFGQHNALVCGISLASGNFVITMDDDLQNPPEEIPKLIEAIQETSMDVVYGIPTQKQHSLLRRLGSHIFHWIITPNSYRASSLQLSNFRIIRRIVIPHLLNRNTPTPLVGLLLASITDRVGVVEVEHHARSRGKTTFSPYKLITIFFNGILYHKTMTFKYVFMTGLFTIFLSIFLVLFYLVLLLFEKTTGTGWAVSVLLILFFSGMILFSMGLLGEYIIRIIQEVSKKPNYIIRDKIM